MFSGPDETSAIASSLRRTTPLVSRSDRVRPRLRQRVLPRCRTVGDRQRARHNASRASSSGISLRSRTLPSSLCPAASSPRESTSPVAADNRECKRQPERSCRRPERSRSYQNSAGRRAGAHRNHPLRFRHLIVDATQHRRHLSRNASRDDHHVSLSRAGAKHFRTKARQIVSRRSRVHHLDRATGQSEGRRPQRRLSRPVDQRIEPRGQHFRQSFGNDVFESHLKNFLTLRSAAGLSRLRCFQSAKQLGLRLQLRAALFSPQSNAPFLTT
jgi:hypothetical protein